MSSPDLSRRDWFRVWLPTGKPAGADASLAGDTPAKPQVAVISGRNCLAYQRSFCSSCVERCPVEGAITSQQGLPRVNPEACIGCLVCFEVFTAPTKAIIFVPARSTPSSSNQHVRT